MVYHGPSKACDVCRSRRVKCDLGQPSCQRCLSRGIACPGTRGMPSDDQFFDQTESIHRMIRRQDARRSKQNQEAPPITATGDQTGMQNDEHAALEPPSDRATPLPVSLSTGQPPRDTLDQSFSLHNSVAIARSAGGSEQATSSAFAFSVDDDVNSILRFWLRYSSMEEAQSNSSENQSIHQAMWQSIFQSFDDVCQGHAIIACLASLASKSTNRDTMMNIAAKYRGYAMHHLQQRLNTGDLTPNIYKGVQTLLAAEAAAHNNEAAAVHAELLVRYYESPHEEHTALAIRPSIQRDDIVRLYFVWLEIQRALFTLTYSKRDSQYWQQLYASSALASLPTSTLGPSSSFSLSQLRAATVDSNALSEQELLDLFKEARLYAQPVPSTDARSPASRKLSFESSTSLLLLCGRLIHFSVDVSQRLDDPADPYLQGTDYALQHLNDLQSVAASLMATFWLRVVGRPNLTVVGFPFLLEEVCAAGPQIGMRIAQLLDDSAFAAQHLLNQTMEYPLDGRAAMFPQLRLRLWILHMADFLESSTSWSNVSLVHGEFRAHLSGLAESLGLSDAPDAYCRIIDGILPLHKDNTFVPSAVMPADRPMDWQHDIDDS